MSNLNISYLIILLLLQLSQRCQTHVTNLSCHPGDYTFLVAGGQRIPEVQNYTRFMVSLRARTATKYFGDNHYCAGVIISIRWILTSAQCIVYPSLLPRRPRTLIVVIGTENRIVSSPTTRLMAVERVVSNPNFTLLSTNDIGMLRLKTNIQLNARVQIMPLPTAPPPYGQRCVVVGWGRLYFKGPYAAMVSHVELVLYTEENCMKSHPRYSKGDLCAGDNIGFDHDPCRGDAGGPLICNDKLVAVVSWTLGCGEKESPSLYSDIYYNLDWIKSVMNEQARLLIGKKIRFILLAEFILMYCL